MKIILAPGDSITGVLSGAATTTNPVAHVDANDKSESVSLSGATAVTLIENESDASSRVVETISVVNLDTAAVTLTISRVAGGTSYKLVNAAVLQVGDVLIYGSDGYSVVDSSGKLKTSSSTTAVEGFSILPTQWRVHDAFASNLPATAASDDLGAVNGTDGTNFMSIRTSDAKAATVTQIARCFMALPSNYVAGSAITLRATAGMVTSVSDNTATIDFNVYSNDGDATGSADICATAEQSINDLTFADKDFVITPTGLVAGQLLNIKLTIAIVDGATGTAVIGALANLSLRCSVSR